jgi:DNA-binding CsgD family transcriptional regulator
MLENMTDPQHTIDLLTAAFELHRGKIDDVAWLSKFAIAANAQSALCLRWSCGKPETLISSASGSYNKVPVGFSNWADHIATLAKPDACASLDELVNRLKRADLTVANPIKDPQLLIALVDWSPSYTFMMAHRDASEGCWTTDEIEHFKSLCELTHKSILLHKELSRAQNLALATTDILNSAPRGIIALSPDGIVQFSNSMAKQVIATNDGIDIKNSALSFTDKESQAVLNEFLASTQKLKPEQLTYGNKDSLRDCAVQRPSGRKPYLLMFSAVALSSWTIDVSPSDRMILVYINDPQKRLQPTEDQLISYYKLTGAQAKVAVQIYAVENIVTVAEVLGISINTARSHLRSIYAKTGANNQSELAKLLTDTIRPPWNDK